MSIKNDYKKLLNESLKKVKEYESYIITGHGNLEIHEDDPNLFIKVPNNLIVVLTFNDIDVSMSADVEIKFYKNVANNKYYIQESLLVNNEDLDKYHFLKNKAIYMPGSCIPNFYIDLTHDPENPEIPSGIFNASNVDIKNNNLNLDKIVYNNLIRNNIRLSEILKEMNKGEKKILLINICYVLVFPEDEDSEIKGFFGRREKELNTHIIFSEEFVKFLRECQLDSLEKFTKKFTCFKKNDVPEYLTRTKKFSYYTYDYENKIRNAKAINDVNKYFSTMSPVSSTSEPLKSNKSSSSILSIDNINFVPTLQSDSILSKKFNKMLSKNVKKLLPVSKSVRTKLRKFNQSLRKKTSTKRKRKSSSLSDVRNSSSKNLRRSKRIRNKV